ncbi:AtpZ/AtpI family protein [Tuberibacillus sp. Marseille-P3662]|uniref:AtpZ/AtpI family protein n=1 Tax=Tuberibacillus sp. Marseille-P3662 TaxID=1965358 RepID=UPI001592FB40|nr:AtpZ/AtpI family protein [Tuberibacillus sp. Marseille-P3662]
MAKPNQTSKRIAIFSGAGLDLAMCILVGVYCGHKLDEWWGTHPVFLLIGLLLGIVSGFYTLYLILKPYIGD